MGTIRHMIVRIAICVVGVIIGGVISVLFMSIFDNITSVVSGIMVMIGVNLIGAIFITEELIDLVYLETRTLSLQRRRIKLEAKLALLEVEKMFLENEFLDNDDDDEDDDESDEDSDDEDESEDD